MSPTGQARVRTVMRSHGQVAALGRWTSTWIVLLANGYLIRNTLATNHTAEPSLWADADVSSCIQGTTHARIRARGSLHMRLVGRHYLP